MEGGGGGNVGRGGGLENGRVGEGRWVSKRQGVGGEEGVNLFGLAARRGLGSNPLRLSFHFKSCGLRTLSLSRCPSQLMKH